MTSDGSAASAIGSALISAGQMARTRFPTPKNQDILNAHGDPEAFQLADHQIRDGPGPERSLPCPKNTGAGLTIRSS